MEAQGKRVRACYPQNTEVDSVNSFAYGYLYNTLMLFALHQTAHTHTHTHTNIDAVFY